MSSLLAPARAGSADTLTEIREMQYRAQHFAVKRLGQHRVGRIAIAKHSADIQ